MYPIILYGSDKSQEIPIALLTAFHHLNTGVLHLTNRTAALQPSTPSSVPYLLIEDGTSYSIQMEHCILIFKDNITNFSQNTLPKACAAILEADNRTAAAILQAHHIPILTCGLSPKNTITFSSRTPEKAVVTLQREIRTASGKKIEPCELPVSLSKTRADYAILASIATLWLTDTNFSSKNFEL